MKPRAKLANVISTVALTVVLIPAGSLAQTNSNERVFTQSKAAVEKALKGMQGSMSGHLPVLDGFATADKYPLDRYQRGFYQAIVQVSSTPSGGSLVRVGTKVTAWFSDPVASSRSGYQLLNSNGRIESDLLDQLSEQLARSPASSETSARALTPAKTGSAPAAVAPPTTAQTSGGSSSVSPAATSPDSNRTFSSPLTRGLPAPRPEDRPSDVPNADKSSSDLQAEAASLEEILKNQAHPKNLVAVKKSGTPVVATPSLTAKAEFLASEHDEFELLNFTADWVHVRISGLARGWIWRNSVEMPEGIADTETSTAAALTPSADLFHVVREEAAPFPGDWAPLRGKNVEILSVQKMDEHGKEAGASDRLEYAKFLLEKSYKEISHKPGDLAGIVVIFDSADGGMIAATLSTLQQWRAGTLSDSALWHQCFFDPPETFDSTASAAAR